jgi:5-methylcytosine-specific restriction endonuclease McrA
MKLPRPCLAPGCPATVTGRAVRCPEHALPDSRHRDPEQARFYGSTTWKLIRLRVRREEPTCRTCGTRPTTEVHHVDGDWRNNSRSNLEGICTPCHRSTSGRDHHAKRGEQPEEHDAGLWIGTPGGGGSR